MTPLQVFAAIRSWAKTWVIPSNAIQYPISRSGLTPDIQQSLDRADASASQTQLTQAITTEANARQKEVEDLNAEIQNTNQALANTGQALSNLNQQTTQGLQNLNIQVENTNKDLQWTNKALWDPYGLEDRVNKHISNNEIHVTQAEKNKWNSGTGNGGIEEAPMDGKPYARMNGTWVEITSAPPQTGFNISSFTHNAGDRERGIPLTDITFGWAYQNGNPVTQSIAPNVGNIAADLRTISLSGQNITDDVTFTLSATDGTTPVTRQAHVRFFFPVFYGSVPTSAPSASDIQAMEKRVAPFTNFTANLSITNARSCFASPMENPITDIRDTIFNLSMIGNYTAIDNVMINGTAYKVWVRNSLEDTGAGTIGLQVIF
jgi:hypothetical protein